MTSKIKSEQLKWFRLDNAAKIYPAVSSPNDSNVFRVAFRLNEIVDKDILQSALNQVIDRFPTFRVKIKRGLFWYFFEYNEKLPVVSPDGEYACGHILTLNNNNYLFKIYYYENRIALEVFHSLSDGGGATEFLKSLVYEYLRLKGYPVKGEGKILTPSTRPSLDETEESFSKYYNSKNNVGDKTKTAFRIPATPIENGFSNIYGWMKTDEVIKLAKTSNATVTEYLASVILFCIYSRHTLKVAKKHDPVRILIPVNLRNFFPSQTLRNFSSYIFAELTNKDCPKSFEDVLEIVKKIFKEQLTEENISRGASAHTKIEKNWLIRIVIRPIKDLVMRAIYFKTGTLALTTNLSNLGKIDMPLSMQPYIDRFEFLSSVPPTRATFGAASSFNGKFLVSFTRRVVEPKLEMDFFRFLAKKGLDITIEGNLFEEFSV